MKTTCLWLLLLAAPALFAQEASPKPSTPQTAPVLGHPLDPADVATLTGRSQTSVPAAYRTPYGTPQVYYPSEMWSGDGRWDWGAQGVFFGHAGRRNRMFFRGNGPFLPFAAFPGLGPRRR